MAFFWSEDALFQVSANFRCLLTNGTSWGGTSTAAVIDAGEESEASPGGRDEAAGEEGSAPSSSESPEFLAALRVRAAPLMHCRIEDCYQV